MALAGKGAAHEWRLIVQVNLTFARQLWLYEVLYTDGPPAIPFGRKESLSKAPRKFRRKSRAAAISSGTPRRARRLATLDERS